MSTTFAIFAPLVESRAPSWEDRQPQSLLAFSSVSLDGARAPFQEDRQSHALMRREADVQVLPPPVVFFTESLQVDEAVSSSRSSIGKEVRHKSNAKLLISLLVVILVFFCVCVCFLVSNAQSEEDVLMRRALDKNKETDDSSSGHEQLATSAMAAPSETKASESLDGERDAAPNIQKPIIPVEMHDEPDAEPPDLQEEGQPQGIDQGGQEHQSPDESSQAGQEGGQEHQSPDESSPAVQEGWYFSEESLANFLDDPTDLDEATLLYHEALDRRQRLGDKHSDTLASINELASLLTEMGYGAEAAPLFHEVLDGRRQQLGDQHLDTLATINSLACLYDSQGDYAQAEPLFREAIESSRQILGDQHPDTLASINNLAFLLQSQGRLAEAEPLIRRAKGVPP